MNMESDDIVLERPVLATAAVALVAAVADVGMQLALDGEIVPVQTAIFVVVFTAVYIGGTYLLRRRNADD
jgi:hypothetical protein